MATKLPFLILLTGFVGFIAVAVAQVFPQFVPPPDPPMSLSAIREVRWTGTILTLTNRVEEYHVRVVNGVHQTNYTAGPRDYFYERVELGLVPGGGVCWRQVRQ